MLSALIRMPRCSTGDSQLWRGVREVSQVWSGALTRQAARAWPYFVFSGAWPYCVFSCAVHLWDVTFRAAIVRFYGEGNERWARGGRARSHRRIYLSGCHDWWCRCFYRENVIDYICLSGFLFAHIVISLPYESEGCKTHQLRN